MKFNQGIGNEIGRWFLLCLQFVLIGGGFLMMGIWSICTGEFVAGLFIILWALLWFYLLALGFHSMAAITLKEDGVYVRVYIKTKFYGWDEIIQTGILWSRYRNIHYNDLVLLRRGGSPRKCQDKTFVRRNQFKLIHLPYSQEILEYLHTYYGPLDFDLSDGKEEVRVATD